MTGRERIGAIALTGYWLLTTLGHLQVSLWLVRRRESEWLGVYRWLDFLPHAGIALGMALAVWQINRARRGRNERRHCASSRSGDRSYSNGPLENSGLQAAIGWMLWLGLAIAFDRLLMYSLPEYLHYPQYALLAGLMAWFIDPDRSRFAFGPVLLAVVLLGIADEALQYTWITISYSNYLDFNDFLLNMHGGTAGLLLYYGFPSRHPAPPAARDLRFGLIGFLALGLILLTLIAALHTADPNPPLALIERTVSYGTWIPGPRSGQYFVLPPVAGTVLLVVLGVLATAAPPVRPRIIHDPTVARRFQVP